MTRRQLIRWYIPAWRAAAKAQGWDRDPKAWCERWGGTETSRLIHAVCSIAAALAKRDGRRVKADDLRHACNALAVRRARQWRSKRDDVPLLLGRRETSSKLMDQLELEIAVAIFQLLTDPDDLSAMMTWLDPEACRRRRIEWAIETQYLPEYITKIAQDRFGTREWRNLPTEDMRRLLMQLSHRPAARKQSARQAKHNVPF